MIFSNENEFTEIVKCSDGMFEKGINGVLRILTVNDKKIEFIQFKDKVLAYVKSPLEYPVYYPLHPVKLQKPLKGILMDLDGTTVKSEEFWIWIIERTVAKLLENPKFELEDADLPHVSGYSISEHLQYCINKYCEGTSLLYARKHYFEITRDEMQKIMDGKGRKNAFTPKEGIKDFLLTVKDKGIKIGLVTSGLYEKAYPEILSAFDTLGMGRPEDFYDSIITAGVLPGNGKCGTLGELEIKPHPWLYSESCKVGLGIGFDDRHSVVGIEDSGAGVCSVRLAGFTAIGISGGNIKQSGTKGLCSDYCNTFDEISKIIF